MSYLNAAIGMRFARIRRDVEDAWEAWSDYLNTADRERVRDAAEVLYGIESRMRSLLYELDHVADEGQEEADDDDL